MSIETTISEDGSFIRFHLKGVFDIKRSLQVQDIVDSLPDSTTLIYMDLAEVTRIDAAIFSTLLLLYYQKDKHSRIEVVNCSKALARRLSLAGLDRLIKVRLSATDNSACQLSDADDDRETKDHQ